MVHYVKIKSEYYNAVRCLNKRFEVRVNDRNYKVGDKVVMYEIDNCGNFTEKEITIFITYILFNYLPDNQIVFSFIILDVND